MYELERLRAITPQDFAVLGLNDVAYVKSVKDKDGKTVYAVHAADGSEMAVLDDREVAFAAIRQNDMEPLSAH
ncbi:MAG: DUF1150 family protein [Alphaproteobacteria bacterium]|nr:DUF1150 family protein [Alphaproteobacteria bacterium]